MPDNCGRRNRCIATPCPAWAMHASVMISQHCLCEAPRHRFSVQGRRLRRARLYDRHSQAWVIIRPGQTWEDGEVRRRHGRSCRFHRACLGRLGPCQDMSAVLEVLICMLQVESPLELETVTPKELARHLQGVCPQPVRPSCRTVACPVCVLAAAWHRLLDGARHLMGVGPAGIGCYQQQAGREANCVDKSAARRSRRQQTQGKT